MSPTLSCQSGFGGDFFSGEDGGQMSTQHRGAFLQDPLLGPKLHAALPPAFIRPAAHRFSLHRFTQNLSIFRRDVAEALRSDSHSELCSLDMMS